MQRQLSTSCLRAIHKTPACRYAAVNIRVAPRYGADRTYASQTTSRTNVTPLAKGEDKASHSSTDRAVLASVGETAKHQDVIASDPVNPPPTTRPPTLTLPTRGSEAYVKYLFRLGRGYAGFYKDGLKAIISNLTLTAAAKTRLETELNQRYFWTDEMLLRAIESDKKEMVSRAEYQLVKRNGRDIGKLPLFAVLVLLLGEWLPLLVPFIPGVVPGTCRYPRQIEGMRQKAEERRRFAFRQGIAEPTSEQLEKTTSTEQSAGNNDAKLWPLAYARYAKKTAGALRGDQLWHLSSVLNLHGRIWDRLQLPPPAFLLRRRVARRLQYIAQDDTLLDRSKKVASLIPDEVAVACEERGIDVLGRPEHDLRPLLSTWIARQCADKGKGVAVMEMLFRRPNAWSTAKSAT